MIKYLSMHCLAKTVRPAAFREIIVASRSFFSKESNIQKRSKEPLQVEDVIPEIQRPHQSDGGIYSV